MPVLELPSVTSWESPFTGREVEDVAAALEAGTVVHLPRLRFPLGPGDGATLGAPVADGRLKNVSLEAGGDRLDGARRGAAAAPLLLLMRRFAVSAAALARAVYRGAAPGRTSFRPTEAAGRAQGWRSDDTRFHVDAFPSRPTGGARILRVFTNLSPDEPRVWRVGEPFEAVAARFAGRLGRPSPVAAAWLERLGVTRGRRTAYDQRMLRLHDAMKRDAEYQAAAPATTQAFPPGATWLAFTDQVSHAVVSGRLAFEQTLLVDLAELRAPGSAPVALLALLDARARPSRA